MNTHAQIQANKRSIKDPGMDVLASSYGHMGDVAIVVERGEMRGDARGDYYHRESNGELVILIVRNSKPITIMYRRMNQPLTNQALRVDAIVDVTAISH